MIQAEGRQAARQELNAAVYADGPQAKLRQIVIFR